MILDSNQPLDSNTFWLTESFQVLRNILDFPTLVAQVFSLSFRRYFFKIHVPVIRGDRWWCLSSLTAEVTSHKL